jgi:hypothetical protein
MKVYNSEYDNYKIILKIIKIIFFKIIIKIKFKYFLNFLFKK